MSMKKLLCSALSVLLLFSAILPAALFPAAAEDSQPYAHAVKVIKALGLMDSENSVDFFENEPLTRQDAVRYILNLKNVEISASGSQQYFKDVSPYDDNYALISTAVRMGIVRGADSYFRPMDQVTGAEAAIMLMRAMDYDNLADPMGGTVTQYISLAMQYDFLNGISDYNTAITRGGFARLLYNSFDIGIMEQTSFGLGSEFAISEDKTSLSYLGLARYTGIVTENSVTSIYDTAEPAPAGQIMIDGNAFDVNNTNAASLLGYRTECYYYDEKGEEIPRIRYITEFENEEMSLDLSAGDLSVRDGKLVYYDDATGRERTVDIDPTTSIILNGKAVPYDLEVLAGLSSTGKILLVNNQDRQVTAKYGVAFVTSQVNDIVRSVDVANNMIYLKHTLIDDKTEIDLNDDYDEKQINLIKDGKSITIGDITPGSVITYVISGDRKSITATFSDRTQQGSIDGYDTEHDGNIAVGGTTYPLAADFHAKDKIAIGSTAILYLNADGYAVDMDITLAKNYAYLAGVEVDDGIEETVRVRLFTANSTFNVLTLADRVNVYEDAIVLDAGASTFHREEVSSRMPAMEVGQKLQEMGSDMIVYNTNSNGLINEIRFAINLDAADPVNTIQDPDDPTKTRTLSIPDLEYYENKFVLTKTLTTNTQANYGNLGGVGTTNTVVFSMPMEGNELAEEECQAAVNLFSTERSYNNVKFYDAGIKGNATVALMQQGVASTITSVNQPLCLFSRTAQVVNNEGEIREKVYYFKNGVEEGLTLAETTTNLAWGSSKKIEDFTFGDLFVYQTNGQGELEVYSTIFDASKTPTQGSLVSQGNGVGLTREFQILCGTARYCGDDGFTLAIADNASFDFYPLMPNNDAYIFRVKMDRETVTTSDLGSIRTETFGSNPSKGELVLVRANRGVVQEVIVYE